MSAWPGKYVIGLTGNIATGKSVVRKMLEHLGAYGIDADALSHRAMSRTAPGYNQIVDTFGKWIVAPDGQIDRAKLSRLVFPDPEAMRSLEAIIHPLVRDAIDVLVRRAKHKIIVIEAIKLLESDLYTYCDSIWVTDAPQDTQTLRLMKNRGMSAEAAWERIHAQGAQSDKLSKADIIIQNHKSFEDTWKQVAAAWQVTVPSEAIAPTPKKKKVPAGTFAVQRARPQEADKIATFINRLSKSQKTLTSSDIMAAFGEKAFLLLMNGDRIVGLMGWQVENLVARVDDVYIEAEISLSKAIKVMTEEVEEASKELQCEAALLFLPPDLAQHQDVWQAVGYEARTVRDLGVRAWQDAAMDSMKPGTVMLFKQLRKDRVLRPV
jgi:dephospho-CoA kinase